MQIYTYQTSEYFTTSHMCLLSLCLCLHILRSFRDGCGFHPVNSDTLQKLEFNLETVLLFHHPYPYLMFLGRHLAVG